MRITAKSFPDIKYYYKYKNKKIVFKGLHSEVLGKNEIFTSRLAL